MIDLRGIASAAVLALLAALPLRAQQGPGTGSETVVAGLSRDAVAISADFTGSDILIYGAVRREQPIDPRRPLEVIVTLQGPPAPVTVRRKARRAGIWLNAEAAAFTEAATFYAVATSGPLDAILNNTEDLRHDITLDRAIRTVGAASAVPDVDSFTDALIRLRREEGLYQLDIGAVRIEESTLFRADIALPANIRDGVYTVRIFLTRDGRVVDRFESEVGVAKVGLERWLFRLAQDWPAVYGLLALVMAVVAGWGASALFQRLRL